MAELIDIYTEDKEPMGTILKSDYYSQDNDGQNPWIKCASCFVIDKKTGKILFEKRGKRVIDPGKLDLCSGHLRHGEVPAQGMIRELNEELSIDFNHSIKMSRIGEVKVDYTNLPNESQRKNLKCFVTVFALALEDVSMIKTDPKEVEGIGWMDYGDAIKFIKFGMTRLPYNDNTEKQYLKVFQSLEEYIRSLSQRPEREFSEK